jgi:hypothetical protein
VHRADPERDVEVDVELRVDAGDQDEPAALPSSV